MKKITIFGLVSLVVLAIIVLMSQIEARGEPLANVDGQAITSEEVEKALGAQLSNLEEQIYKLKRQKLEELINAALLTKEAGKRGISVLALLDAEVTSNVAVVTEQEVETYYQANKGRIQNQGDEATVRQQVRAYLQNQKIAAQKEQYFQTLQSQGKVVVSLKPPPVFRAEVSTYDAPFKGPANATVTIVKFEDFQCPFCKQAQAIEAQLLSRFTKTVKLVHRDFPIDSLHPLARKAHEAARCANEQGKFWEYHDLLYTNAPKASPEDLQTYAKQVGLDTPAFEQCLASGKYKSLVQKDVDEGTRLGVNGTPTFFINGRVLSGAQPFEIFTGIIDDELTRSH
jgi:protein-disulfide isomerase